MQEKPVIERKKLVARTPAGGVIIPHVPPKKAQSVSNLRGKTPKASAPSNASVRGSDVTSDFAALTETIVATDADDGRFSVSNLTSVPSMYRHEDKSNEPTMRDIKSGLDKNEQLKVEDWLSLDVNAFNPQYTSTRKHFLRIINTLDYDEKIIEVCNYMTVNDLVYFYESYNYKCREYIWKDIWGQELMLNKTLEENKLMDKSVICDEIGLDHFPTILLYYRDGFENEPKMQLDISINPTPINSTLLAPPRNY